MQILDEGTCNKFLSCKKIHFQQTTLNFRKKQELINNQIINEKLLKQNKILVTISTQQLMDVTQLTQLLNQEYEGISQQIKVSFQNNKSLKQMKKEIQKNRKNEKINKQQKKDNNLQIIEKYIPLIMRDTKEENSQKIIQEQQKSLENQKLKKMIKNKQNMIQIVNEEDEETKQNKQQQTNKIKSNTQYQNITQQQQEILEILRNNNDTISEESDQSRNNTSQINSYNNNFTNQIPQNTQVLTSTTTNQDHSQQSSDNIQNTQNNTKSSVQQGQLMQGQPQSPKFTKPYKPESQNQIQIFKQYRDENDILNITPSSAEIETIAYSNDQQKAKELIQQNQRYDLNIIMKKKAYKNDAMQKIKSQQYPQLGKPEKDKFIIGATTISMNQEIKQEFIQNCQNVYKKAQQITGKNVLSINVVYNYRKWDKIISVYNQEDLIIQIAKLYEEGIDLNNSHFLKNEKLQRLFDYQEKNIKKKKICIISIR